MNETMLAVLAQWNVNQVLQLLGFVVVVFSLCVHESAHAVTAHWGGDDTAKSLGRITLNPISHIDPFGTILLPLLSRFSGIPIIGWAKPVPFVASKLRSNLWIVWVAGAGPLSNVLLALVAGFWLKVLTGLFGDGLPEPVLFLLYLFVVINIGLAVFNMIPIPPLDGSKFLFHYVIDGRPHLYPVWETLERFGFIFLYAIILIPAAKGLLGTAIRFATGLIGKLYGLPIL